MQVTLSLIGQCHAVSLLETSIGQSQVVKSGEKGKKMTLSLDGRSDRLIMDTRRQNAFGTIIITIHTLLPPGVKLGAFLCLL